MREKLKRWFSGLLLKAATTPCGMGTFDDGRGFWIRLSSKKISTVDIKRAVSMNDALLDQVSEGEQGCKYC